MRLYLKHPRSGKPDGMYTLAVVVTVVASIKFLLDGVVITIAHHTLNFGHVDSMSYGSLLTPVLGAHSYVDNQSRKEEMSEKVKVDNPDQE